jgi:cell division transport system permease protein
MKISSVGFIIKEGLRNARKHLLMSIISIGTTTMALMIVGIFILVMVNIGDFINEVRNATTLNVYCSVNATQPQIDAVENAIKANSQVKEYKIISKEQAWDIMKSDSKNKVSALSGFGAEDMEISFVIKLNDLSKMGEVANTLQKFDNVDPIEVPTRTTGLIDYVSDIVKIISIVLILILLVVSVFLLSNTVKLTVYARRKEIGVMKFIGAKNSFIEVPFIIEGLLLGFIGAVIAILIITFGYEFIESSINHSLVASGQGVYKIRNLNEVIRIIFLSFISIGMAVGAFGSIIAIRKYLKV